MNYFNLKKIFGIFACVFLLLSFLVESFTHDELKLYPYYSWRLFSILEAPPLNYEFLFLNLDEETFQDPKSFVQLELEGKVRKMVSVPERMAFRLGKVFEFGNSYDAEIMLKNFVRVFLNNYKSGSFEIVKWTWDPETRFKSRSAKFNYKILNKFARVQFKTLGEDIGISIVRL